MKSREIALNCWAIVLTSALSMSAHAGGADGHGGDPRVAAFLNAAEAACTWMQSESDLNSKAETCRNELADLTASVNDKKRVARVYSDALPAEDNGVPKDAVTDENTKRIHINISRWESESVLEQKVTVAMEMALLLGLPNRYTLGQRLTFELAASVAQSKPSDLKIFQNWAYNYIDTTHVDNRPSASIWGETADKTPCALFIIDHSGRDIPGINDIYLSLGFGPALKPGESNPNDEYIGGGITNELHDLQMSLHEIHFRSIDYEIVGFEKNGNPIAKFSDRRLLVELTDSGVVFRVTGTSSRLGQQPIVCNMKME